MNKIKINATIQKKVHVFIFILPQGILKHLKLVSDEWFLNAMTSILVLIISDISVTGVW